MVFGRPPGLSEPLFLHLWDGMVVSGVRERVGVSQEPPAAQRCCDQSCCSLCFLSLSAVFFPRLSVAWWLSTQTLILNPLELESQLCHLLCDPVQVTQPLCATVSYGNLDTIKKIPHRFENVSWNSHVMVGAEAASLGYNKKLTELE